MTPDPRIGLYVTRVNPVTMADSVTVDEPLTRPHYVESIVSDEPITRCGRRFRWFEGTAFRYEASTPLRICKQCVPDVSVSAGADPVKTDESVP